MTEQKLGKWEAIILIVAIVINHIILGLPRSIVAEHASASILNVIYISAIVIILIFLICKLLESFPGLDIIDIAEFLGGKVLKIGISILFLLYIIFITGILLRSFSEGLKLIFFPRTSLPIIMILFLIAIVIMNKLNIVSIARANLFFTILVSVSMIFIFIGNWKDLTFQKIFPILGNGAYTTFFSGLSDLFAFGGIACIYLLPPYLKNQKDFKKTINEILTEGKIEGKDIKNIDTLKYLLDDRKINKSLYDGFTKNYEMEYGSNRDYILMKIQDMLYRLHLLVNYNFVERYGIIDKNNIRNAISILIDNDDIDFYDAVSFDDSDFEIVDLQDFDVRNVLCIKNI